MKKVSIVLLLSIFIVSCSAYERGRAITLEEKRDFLLKNSQQYTPNYLSKTPISIYELRNKVVSSGMETKEFLNILINRCYNSNGDYCALEVYYDAFNKIDQNNKKIKNRKEQTPVKMGDLFYCRVEFNVPSGPVDSSEMRVSVKDNVDTVGFLFSNGYQIISPELEVVDPVSGERHGNSSDGSFDVRASYDGGRYRITLFDDIMLRRFNGVVVTHTSKLGLAGSIEVFDCKK